MLNVRSARKKKVIRLFEKLEFDHSQSFVFNQHHCKKDQKIKKAQFVAKILISHNIF